MTTPTFTTPPVIVPTRGSATYSVDASAWVTFQNAFEGELSTAMPWVAARVADVADDLVLTNADVLLTAADVVSTATSALAAAATADAVTWVSSASYTAIVSNVISPVDFGTYRAKTTHTGVATDPSADATNWVIISAKSFVSPAFTGTPTAPTATVGTDTTQVATTAFVLANGSAGGLTPIGTKQTLSAVAATDIALTGGYDEYTIKFWGFVPATNGALLYLRTSTDAGATFDSGGGDYLWTLIRTNTGGGTTPQMYVSTISGDNQFIASSNTGTGGISNTAGYGSSGEVKIFKPHAATATILQARSDIWVNTTSMAGSFVSGSRVALEDVDTVRLFFSAGNITTGEYQLYGAATG
jgi:hypothetical protein